MDGLRRALFHQNCKKGQVLLLNQIGALIAIVLGLISGILSIEAFLLRSTHV